MVLFHDYQTGPTFKSVRRAVMKIGEDIFPLLFEVKHGDIAAQSDYKKERKHNINLSMWYRQELITKRQKQQHHATNHVIIAGGAGPRRI